MYGKCGLNDPCKNVTCPPFEACDVNNNGACECGGAPSENIPGVVCASGQSCVDPFDGGEPTCMQNCQPFGTPCPSIIVADSGVTEPVGCYYFQASKAAVCAQPTSDAGATTSNCLLATDCSAANANNNLTCASYLTDGGAVLVGPTCVSYCDVFPAGGPTSTPPPDGGTHPCGMGYTCVPLPTGIVAGICEL